MNNCTFLHEGHCAILKVGSCPNTCKFKKTAAEFEAAQKEADRILFDKGLERCQKIIDKGEVIVTTRKVW